MAAGRFTAPPGMSGFGQQWCVDKSLWLLRCRLQPEPVSGPFEDADVFSDIENVDLRVARPGPGSHIRALGRSHHLAGVERTVRRRHR